MIRKVLVALLSLVCIVACAFGLSACGTDGGGHTHYWSESWQSNETHHWHNCTVSGCTLTDDSKKDGYAPHDFSNGNCICGKGATSELNYTLNSDNESYSVTGIKKIYGSEIVIASDYNGKPVTNIRSEAFAEHSSITSITIPNSVTDIGDRAFYNCSSLTNITIPDSVTSIGYYAFYNCNSLTSITIPDSVISIGDRPFEGCAFETVTIPAVVCSQIKNSPLKTAIISSGEIIDNAFYNCNSLTNITIPDSITSIVNNSFSYCNSIETITYTGNIESWCKITGLPQLMSNVTPGLQLYIGENEITGELNIPDTITNIGHYAFYRCSSLTNVIIPDSVTDIGDSAFKECNLTSITLPDSISSIGAYAFQDCNFTSITIPDSVTSIDFGAFKNCPIETATIPAIACTYISNSSLKSVTISGETIENRAFYRCDSLQSVTLLDGITSIGTSAFYSCNLTNISLPDSVTNIDEYAFYACNKFEKINYNGDIADWCKISGLENLMHWSYLKTLCFNETEFKEIVIPDGVTSIGKEAFYGCDITSISLPDSVTSIGSDAFYACPNIETASLPEFAISLIPHNNLKTVVIISGDSIAARAFSGCSLLTNVTIPDSVTNIGDGAFRGCSSLTNITIPDSVTNIGSDAFHGCSSLTSITIPDSVKSVGSDAFYGCPIETAAVPEFAISYIPQKELKTLTITYGKCIGSYAFYDYSSLTSISLPDSLTGISYSAFMNCEKLQYNEYNNAYYLGNSANPYLALVKLTDTTITSFNIHENTKVIAVDALAYCGNLKYNEYDNAYYLGSSTNPYFALIKAKNTAITSCTINENTNIIANNSFFDCKSLESLTVESGNKKYHSNENCIIETASRTLVAGCKSSVIPTDDSVTSIGAFAFAGCSSLTHIEIPSNITDIGLSAFNGCSSLTSITIPFVGASIDGLYNTHFAYIFGATGKSDNMDSKYVPWSLKTVTITGGEAIGDSAFYGCKFLTSIAIPVSVTIIKYSAFSQLSNLVNINYDGTMEQWNAIEKKYAWNFYTGNYTIHCTDGDLAKN